MLLEELHDHWLMDNVLLRNNSLEVKNVFIKIIFKIADKKKQN